MNESLESSGFHHEWKPKSHTSFRILNFLSKKIVKLKGDHKLSRFFILSWKKILNVNEKADPLAKFNFGVHFLPATILGIRAFFNALLDWLLVLGTFKHSREHDLQHFVFWLFVVLLLLAMGFCKHYITA